MIQALSGQLLLGLINGSFYALLSLGLAIIFGLLLEKRTGLVNTSLHMVLPGWDPRGDVRALEMDGRGALPGGDEDDGESALADGQ